MHRSDRFPPVRRNSHQGRRRGATALLAAAALALSGFAHADEFVLQSADLREGEQVPALHLFPACAGGNVSPALEWKNPPEGTRSFAITVFDPDAPTGNGWWHWALVNLPADTSALARGAKPPAGAMALRNDFGVAGYSGPCPPPGKTHRYEFTVWALKSDKLKLDAKAQAMLGGAMARADALGHARITVKYSRPK